MFHWKATAAALAVVAMSLTGGQAQETRGDTLTLGQFLPPLTFDTKNAEWAIAPSISKRSTTRCFA